MNHHFRYLLWVALALVVFSFVLVLYNYAQNQDALATAINSYVGPLLPNLGPMPELKADVPIGTNAVWWIGDGTQYTTGGIKKSTGVMQSSWGGRFPAMTPRFSELESILIVRGTLGEEKEYLLVPNDMVPDNFVFNPFKSGPPTSFVDKHGKVHSADEFRHSLKTYGLQVWIVDIRSNRIVAYREFPAAHLLDEYDENHATEAVPLNALVGWIESLEKMGRKP